MAPHRSANRRRRHRLSRRERACRLLRQHHLSAQRQSGILGLPDAACVLGHLRALRRRLVQPDRDRRLRLCGRRAEQPRLLSALSAADAMGRDDCWAASSRISTSPASSSRGSRLRSRCRCSTGWLASICRTKAPSEPSPMPPSFHRRTSSASSTPKACSTSAWSAPCSRCARDTGCGRRSPAR